MVVKIIHSGLFLELIKDSINFKRFIALSSATFDFIVLIALLKVSFSFSKFKLLKSSLIASAPIPTVKDSSPNSSWALIYSSSEISWFFLNLVRPGSNTIKLSKYKTFSTSINFISTAKDILLGKDFKNQICATGDASSMWPILSLRTFARVTSTPHFSQTMPLNFILLYFPHKHS